MYAALSAQLSGSLRHTHSRLSEFAEEIAFMGGEETEKMLIEREYASVVKHEHRVLGRRWWFGCIEEGVIKWLWGSFGVRQSLLCQFNHGHNTDIKLTVLYSWFFAPSPYSSSYRESRISILAAARKVCCTDIYFGFRRSDTDIRRSI